ncbi:Dna2/Cas4 domain-containing protein [Candidatus Woesearchaeota archaeon]|nr:Dna2/Cas4 domain-containing protein [Candidatus Woesearchaeota archaeon]
MAKRVQSPSSINTYRQCPRRYYYQYVLRLPTRPSIHLLRGTIVHAVLENFFSLDPSTLSNDEYRFGIRAYIQACLFKEWKNRKKELRKLGLSDPELEQYLIESQEMVISFADKFSDKLELKLSSGIGINKAFELLKPEMEQDMGNDELMIRGRIDAIHRDSSRTLILDYKTSNKDEISPEYRLQLGIYSLMYKLNYGIMPDKAGINFLKFGEKFIDVSNELLDEAEKEIKFVHEMTSSENIADYPRKESGLCKWHSGQCDFYDECMNN